MALLMKSWPIINWAKPSCGKVRQEAGTKVLASQLFLDCRAKRSGWVGSTTLISSAFTALFNYAEVGRRNRILTNDRFLSHSHLTSIIKIDLLNLIRIPKKSHFSFDPLVHPFDLHKKQLSHLSLWRSNWACLPNHLYDWNSRNYRNHSVVCSHLAF